MSEELVVYTDSKKSFEDHCSLWGYDTQIDDDGFYVSPVTQRLFNVYDDAWQASRKALVVELPNVHTIDGYFYVDLSMIEIALNEAGVTYK